jgi:drug/metabolite transporter (DMT)-like permease
VTRALLQIHLCVFLWGFTAILGRLISVSAAQIVFWRCLLVCALLALLPRVWRALRAMPPRALTQYAAIGVIVMAHWLTFFLSVKLANASVAAVALAVAPAITALIEPLVTRTAFRPTDFALGAAMVPGMMLVFGGVPAGMIEGFLVGLLSAALVAVFIALNKRYIGERDALAVTAVEVGFGGLVLAGLLLFSGSFAAALDANLTASPARESSIVERAAWLFTWPSLPDLGWLLLLASLFTIVPFALSLVALRQLSAFSAQLAVNLEPLYTVALAALFLGEARGLDARFYWGAALVVGSVIIYGAFSAARNRRPASPAPVSLRGHQDA